MLAAHHIVAALLILVCGAAGISALVFRRRGTAPPWLAQLIALAQTVVIAQAALGLLLLSGHHHVKDKLHYAYGAFALAAVLSPWLYAPPQPRARLAWFGGAALVAAALGVRGWMTA